MSDYFDLDEAYSQFDRTTNRAVVKWSLMNSLHLGSLKAKQKGGMEMIIVPNKDGTYTLQCNNGYKLTGSYQECRYKADEILDKAWYDFMKDHVNERMTREITVFLNNR